MSTDPSRDAACDDVFQQLFAINRMARVVGAEIYRRMGIQRTQVALLGSVARRGEVRLSDLACEQQVDPSVVSRQLQGLEQEGLVTRRPDPDDRRATLVRLTDDGTATLARAVGMYRDAVASWLADWSTTEIEHTAAALRRMAGSQALVDTETGA